MENYEGLQGTFSGTELCEEEASRVKLFSVDTASDPGPPPSGAEFQGY